MPTPEIPSLAQMLNHRVVLDTQGPLLYIGSLTAVDERGYWLRDADVHDRHDGHASKELYILEARLLELSGTRNINRRRVFVERHGVISISLLADVLVGSEHDPPEDPGERP